MAELLVQLSQGTSTLFTYMLKFSSRERARHHQLKAADKKASSKALS
jgi:hypothetical protein